MSLNGIDHIYISRWEYLNPVIGPTSRHFQTLPDTSRHFQTLPDTSRHFQTLPVTSRHFQTLPDTSRHFRLGSLYFKRLESTLSKILSAAIPDLR
jgi:hypothetical protein